MSDSNPNEATAPRAFETIVDKAWRAAQEITASDLSVEGAERLRDQAAAEFIDVLLTEPLFCPIWDTAEADETSIAPKLIERDGVDQIVLFDSEERMIAFAKEPTEYVVYAGRVFFRLATGQDTHIALNPGVAPSETVFHPETIDAIAELADAAEEEVEISADSPLTILPPDDASDNLLRALLARIAASSGIISEAWLFTAVQELESPPTEFDDEGEEPADPDEYRQLVIGVTSQEPRQPQEIQNLVSELGRIGLSSASTPFAVALFEPSDRLLAIARDVGLDLAGRSGEAARSATSF